MTFNEQLHKALSSCVNSSQESSAGHAKLLIKCQQLFKESNFDDFFESFKIIIQNILITMIKNPNIDRIIEFISKFAVSLSTSTSTSLSTTIKNNNNNNNNNVTVINNEINNQTTEMPTIINNSQTITETTTDEIENPFLVSLINYLLNNHKANSDAVRYRCCQIVTKLMGSINSEQFIDEDLFDKLCDAMLERLKDVNSRVQTQAVSAIHRLQDPNDRNCRVIKALLFLMAHDPHWQVRYQALSHIAFSKQTLPNIIDRVRDVHPTIRRKALLILSEKVLIKFISIEKRIFILNYSLKDDDPLVLETCCKKLLPSWLAFKENNIIKLLKALDVVEATETVEIMLNKMYADDSLESLCKDFNLINEKHVIDIDKLDVESVTYWKWLCDKCKSAENENCLDIILPSLTEFCDYIKKVLEKINENINDSLDNNRKRSENNFLLKQLIKMFSYLDFVDMHGKKAVVSFCQEIFANKDYAFLFETVMTAYKQAVPKLEQRINNLVELISDLKDSNGLIDNEIDNQDMQANCANNISNNNNKSTSTPRPTPRELSTRITELKFQRFKINEEFDNLYKDTRNVNKTIDMNRITELRTQLKEVEDELNKLQSELSLNENIQLTPVIANDNINLNNNDKLLDTSIEIDNIFHCLQLSVCLLEDIELKTLTPQLRTLCDTLILPSVGSVNEDVRAMAVRALNLICILKVDIAQKYVPLFLEMIQRDKKEIVIEAFKAIINSIMAYSLNKLVSHLDDTDQVKTEATTKIISIMTSLLDHEDSDIYTYAVEGFCKLFMTGHIISAKLFSKLLIMYYSPLTENDKKLRSILACFLPQFSFLRSTNQICVEESFMTTIKSLINASSDSYLSEIDLMKVTETLLHLTNPKNVLRKQRQFINNTCHENIGKAICFEILHEDNTFKFRTYLKILNTIDLSLADYFTLKELRRLANDVIEHITDRLLKKSAQKFLETIESFIIKNPEYEREKQQQEQQNSCLSEKNNDNNETKIENANCTLVKSQTNTSLNSSEIIDIEFKKINKKLKLSNDKKQSSMINESTIANKTTELSKTLKNCSVILNRINDSVVLSKTKSNNSDSEIECTLEKRPENKNSTVNESRVTRSRSSIGNSKLDESNDRTLTPSVSSKLRHSTRLSKTPSSIEKSIVNKKQQKRPQVSETSRKTRSKHISTSDSDIECTFVKTASKTKNPTRTQSESPCTSVEYEPPSKLRKSNRIQSANNRPTGRTLSRRRK